MRLLISAPLYVLSIFYRIVIFINRTLYLTGIRKAVGVSVRTIGIGNISIGGTGKTPMAAYIAGLFSNSGKEAVIISRGYGRIQQPEDKGVSGMTFPSDDEDMLFFRPIKNVKRITGPDKRKLLRDACGTGNPDVIIIDDAFQSGYLRVDCHLVMINCAEPPFGAALFPAGPLREPVSALRRADAAVLTGTMAVENEDVEELERRLKRLVKSGIVLKMNYAVDGLTKAASGEITPCAEVKGRRCYAFCGIAEPGSFRRTVAALGAEIAGFMDFPDHFSYTPGDVNMIYEEAEKCSAGFILTTEKDMTKLLRIAGNRLPPLYAVRISPFFDKTDSLALMKLAGLP